MSWADRIQPTKVGDKTAAIVDWHDGREPRQVIASRLPHESRNAFDQ